MRRLLSIIFLVQAHVLLHAQAPAVEWQKVFGGSDFDEGYCIRQTADGGYILAGYSQSVDGDVSENHSAGTLYGDCWVVKLDKTGDLEWQRCLGGTGQEAMFSVLQTIDGGYIVAGYTQSNDGDVNGNHSNASDAWIVKLGSAGDIEWQKPLGGVLSEEASSIKQTADGGYIVAAKAGSYDGDVSGHHGGGDFWVLKLDDEGSVQWQKCLGGSDSDASFDIQQTQDGGYIVCGVSASADGDVSVNHGLLDGWVVKLNDAGNIQWQKSLGGSDDEYLNSVRQSTDGSYIVAGYTRSNDGDVSGNHGGLDFWIVKLDNGGSIVWEKCLGGSGADEALSVLPVADGGYIVSGSSSSSDGDLTGNQGNEDYWIVKLDNAGDIQWQKNLGGTNTDVANSLQQTADGGLVVAGYASSGNGDVSVNYGAADVWVIKLADIALPVTWGQISVVNTAKVNSLTWITHTEANTSHFDIERSTDGTHFTKIGRHAATGNSSSIVSYAFEDANPVAGKNYYRIRQVDMDGKYRYSRIVSIEVSESSGRMKLFPNPVNNVLTINVPAIPGKYVISVVDAAGRLATRSVVPGNSLINLQLRHLADGVYHITVMDGLKTYRAKFVKSNK